MSVGSALLLLVLAIGFRCSVGGLSDIHSGSFFPFPAGNYNVFTVNYPPPEVERLAADMLVLVALQYLTLAILFRGYRMPRLLVVWLVVWPFVLIEADLRAWMSWHPTPHYPDALMEYAPREGFTLESGDTPMRNNSRGLRSPEIPRDKPPGVIRVMILGDSATWGSMVGVEETYPRQLELIATKLAGGVRLQVVNAAVGGFCSLQGLEHARRLLPWYRPDVVLFGYNNDGMAISDVADRDRVPSHPVTRAVQQALYQSETYLLLRRELLNHFGPPPVPPDRRPPQWGYPNRVSLQDHAANYRALIDLARAHGARPGILILPSRHPPGYDDTDRYVAAGAGVACVDFTALWKRTRETIDDLTFDGIHPTERGHRLLARLLWEGLQAEGYLPEAAVASWPAPFDFSPTPGEKRAVWEFSPQGARRVR